MKSLLPPNDSVLHGRTPADQVRRRLLAQGLGTAVWGSKPEGLSDECWQDWQELIPPVPSDLSQKHKGEKASRELENYRPAFFGLFAIFCNVAIDWSCRGLDLLGTAAHERDQKLVEDAFQEIRYSSGKLSDDWSRIVDRSDEYTELESTPSIEGVDIRELERYTRHIFGKANAFMRAKSSFILNHVSTEYAAAQSKGEKNSFDYALEISSLHMRWARSGVFTKSADSSKQDGSEDWPEGVTAKPGNFFSPILGGIDVAVAVLEPFVIAALRRRKITNNVRHDSVSVWSSLQDDLKVVRLLASMGVEQNDEINNKLDDPVEGPLLAERLRNEFQKGKGSGSRAERLLDIDHSRSEFAVIGCPALSTSVHPVMPHEKLQPGIDVYFRTMTDLLYDLGAFGPIATPARDLRAAERAKRVSATPDASQCMYQELQ